MRRVLIPGAVGLLMSGLLLQATEITRGPYLQDPTATSIQVAWYTSDAQTTILSYRAVAAWKRITGIRSGQQQHCTLAGLKPQTRYSYRILDAHDAVLASSSFTTAPRTGASSALRIAAVGDSGTGDPAQYRVAGQIARWKPQVLLHTGDVVYPDGAEPDYTAEFFGPYHDILPTTPVFPALGNHDAIQIDGFLGVFILPGARSRSSTERYYSADYGNAHFTVLDTNQSFSPGSAQRSWVESDLARSARRPGRWRFVILHHPPFSDGPHGGSASVQQELVPLFERYGVDAVLSGHDHAYQRTDPYSASGNPSTALRYFVTGGGGAGLYGQQTSAPPIVRYFARYHFLGMIIEHGTLRVQAIDEYGIVFDEIVVKKTVQPRPQRSSQVPTPLARARR